MANLHVQPKRKNYLWVWILIIVILIVAAVIYYMNNYKKDATSALNESSSLTLKLAQIDVDNPHIQVINLY